MIRSFLEEQIHIKIVVNDANVLTVPIKYKFFRKVTDAVLHNCGPDWQN